MINVICERDYTLMMCMCTRIGILLKSDVLIDIESFVD